MRKRKYLIFLVLLFPVLAIAQIPDSSSVNKVNDTFAWLSFGPGGANKSIGFNFNANVAFGKHYLTAQFADLDAFVMFHFADRPHDYSQEFNITYGRRYCDNSYAALFTAGLCYIDSRDYYLSETYGVGWTYDDVSYYGVTFKGQVLFQSKSVGIGPSVIINLGEGRKNMSFFLDLALGKLK